MRTHSRQPQQDLVKSAGETIEIQCSSDSHEYIYWNYPRESLAIEVKHVTCVIIPNSNYFACKPGIESRMSLPNMPNSPNKTWFIKSLWLLDLIEWSDHNSGPIIGPELWWTLWLGTYFVIGHEKITLGPDDIIELCSLSPSGCCNRFSASCGRDHNSRIRRWVHKYSNTV